MVAEDGTTSEVAFLRIDQTAPWLFQPMTYLAQLASPLAWLAIGATLGSVKLKTAITDRTSLFYSFNKVVIVPILNIVILAILALTNILVIGDVSLGTIVIMMATPTATVAAAYAISFDRDALLASNASLLSTIAAVIFIPIWIVVINLIAATAIFG